MTWFRVQNQVWVEGEADRLFSWVADGDADWVAVERKRWERIRELQRERRLKPLKGETRIRVLDEEKTELGQIAMNVIVHQRFLYTLGKELSEQEEVNGYYLRLAEGEDGWSIAECRPAEGLDTESGKIWSSYQPPSQRGVAGSGYKRGKAVQYAETWWNGANPRYRKFEDDCTNFISQCLHAGGVPMEFSSRRDRGWWYRGSRENWSYSWAVAHALKNYLDSGGTPRAERVDSPEKLHLGDVICYDFEGDGRWQHNTIVTAKDPAGMPLVNAHTVNSRRRYWDYRDSHAWTPQIRYRFFHIPD
ncbi:amidase domain-containing protein [Paludifilum halophilum]|nr:amidase domain-containing protein [Paludifilum halophilum]